MAQSFYTFRRNLEETFDKLRKLQVPVSLDVGNVPQIGFQEILVDFAKDYMERIFVKQFLIPAYQAMNLPNEPSPFMPKIKNRRRGGHKSHGNAVYDEFVAVSQALNEVDLRTRRGKKRHKTLTEERERIIQRLQKSQEAESKSDRFFAEENRNDPQAVIALWQSGFRQMLDIIKTVNRPTIDGADVVVSMGSIRKLLTMKLGSYSVTEGRSTPSRLDSFFYAAEFGTGIPANVGGRVNTEGRTKVSVDGVPGYWWFGDKDVNGHWHGALFSGQRGTHFFFQAGSDTPNPRIQQYIGSTIQDALNAFFKSRR